MDCHSWLGLQEHAALLKLTVLWPCKLDRRYSDVNKSNSVIISPLGGVGRVLNHNSYILKKQTKTEAWHGSKAAHLILISEYCPDKVMVSMVSVTSY